MSGIGAAAAPSHAGDQARDDLTMAPELMLDLARRTAELMVERIEGLPGERAWDGEFKEALDHQLMAEPPEQGRPPMEVIEQAAREISPVRDAVGSPAVLWVRPLVAHVARRVGRFHGRRASHQRLHLAGRERADPGRAGGDRLVSPLDRLPGERARAVAT